MTKLKCWKKTGISKTSIWWKNGDQNVNVTDIPQTEQWFAFIDPGKKFKARTEIALPPTTNYQDVRLDKIIPNPHTNSR